ncbi:alpha-1,6-glucosidase domain-containing protein [Aquabacterium humicola]|uniref:alpha-1,6-glucosidase domain-containing protein n=1 Tax=Aquabacterium humicola TaxID=3237377 RepID=UPI002542B401|nr:alpha-1,6-glucosidase domain-containing protein [Rubrivivax pictus]
MPLPIVALLLSLMAPAAVAASPSLTDCDSSAFARTLLAAAQPAPPTPEPEPKPAQAVWLSGTVLQWPQMAVADGTRFRLYHAKDASLAALDGRPMRGADGVVDLRPAAAPADAAQRFRHVAAGLVLQADADPASLRRLHRSQTLLVHEDAQGRVLRSTPLQAAAALDELFAAAEAAALGATLRRDGADWRLWAPTAQQVALCLHDSADGPARRLVAMQADEASGVWSARLPAPLPGRFYRYLVDVIVPGVGLVRNRVTDPYALALSADSQRAWLADLDAPALKPPGWDAHRTPQTVRAPTDLVIYELHVRDFSIGDASVSAANRGKYAAFAEPRSAGMRHLAALAKAGLTDVHLLPVFDLATIPERGCTSPPASALQGPPDGEAQQAAVMAGAATDCFNWGYDPWHYTVPEGSYASDAADPAKRIVEFRRMVMALHRAGLRIGMDVVYNHTAASGQQAKSLLDRIVPGYYHRLNAQGVVERSTCCDNTATEHRMMGKLMIDSVLTWAKAYRIDSFRFDLMGHQPKAAMLDLQRRLKTELGRDIPLIGEGWNFGEVADGARFEQASQLSLNGTGIATFSDRARDALRGRGGLHAQGWLNGLHFDPHPAAPPATRDDLLRAADLARVGLAGSIRRYRLQTADGTVQALEALRYGGQQPAGYVAEPSEVVNYVENHDNSTFFDDAAAKLPPGTSRIDRARVQLLGAAAVAFSQGLAYFHAGQDLLRSKSMDGNSFDSGDWFNRLDFSYRDNGFGAGLPPRPDNARDWPAMKALLADASIKPGPAEIAWMRDAFRDLLAIRASSTLFRLRSAADIEARLQFPNTGPQQVPTVLAGHLRGEGYPGARFREIVYLLNADKAAQTIVVDAVRGQGFRLHPVHLKPHAAERRARTDARFDRAAGRFTVPPRSAVVWVRD